MKEEGGVCVCVLEGLTWFGRINEFVIVIIVIVVIVVVLVIVVV